MKKFLSIILVIALAVTSLCVYNIYSDGALVQTMDSLTRREETTTSAALPQTENSSAAINTVSLARQLHSALTEDEQTAFDIIYEGLSSFKPSVNIYQNIDAQRIFELVNLVLAQHPEIFWSKGDCSFSSSGRLAFKYPYTYDEVQEKNARIEQKVREINNEIRDSGSDYENSLALFEYVTLHTSYATEEIEDLDNHLEVMTIEGALLNGRALCSGYARAYQYLLNLYGIDAITVSGEARSSKGTERHAWNAQVIDGEIYFSDTTWADGYEVEEDKDFVIHTYFLMNTAELEKTHTSDDCFAGIKSTSDKSYFVREGLYFEEYDFSDIKEKTKESFESGAMGVELQFADSAAFEKARKNLFDNESVYLILKMLDPFSRTMYTNVINFTCNETHNTITLFFCFKD